MEFKLSQGPWEQLFSGELLGYETELYSNLDQHLMSVVYEKEGGKKVSAILEITRPLLAKGEVESFLETLPRKAMVLEHRYENETFKFLLLDSGPSYVRFEEEAFRKEIDDQIEKVAALERVVRDVAVAYDLLIRDLKEASEAEKSAFYSIPLLVSLLSPSSRRGQVMSMPTASAPSSQATGKQTGQGAVLFGITRRGQVMTEPLANYATTLVSGGSEPMRRHVFHVLAESAILSGVTAILVDFSQGFACLQLVNQDTARLEEYGIGIEPVGFPVKTLEAGKDVWVDLSLLDPEGLLDVFGLGDTAVKEAIVKLFTSQQVGSLEEAVKKVESLPETEENLNQFKKNRAARILRLVDYRYQGLFNGENLVREITRGWLQGWGRGIVLQFSPEDNRKNLLILHTLVRGIIEELSKTGKSNHLKTMLFLAHGKEMVPRTGASLLTETIAADLAAGTSYGLGFAIECQEIPEISDKIRTAAQARISVISQNDVGVQTSSSKSFRVLLRPGFSTCEEGKVDFLKVEAAKAEEDTYTPE